MARFFIVTYGCQMNEHDSARMAEVLTRAGHVAVFAANEAEVVVLNTCSIRDKAEQKLRSDVGRWALAKRGVRKVTLVVAGCVGQQHGERLIRRIPEIDLVIGPDNIPELPELLCELQLGGPRRAVTEFDSDGQRFLSAMPEFGTVPRSAFVTIMKGCDEHCTYCIVPFTRGDERYRPSAAILEEIERLVEAGAKEVTLLGQTVNSYQDPSGLLVAGAEGNQFPNLLRTIVSRFPGLLRLRYVSPHPRHLTSELILAHAELPVLAKHLHLPVQSGSNRVLRRMLRRTTVEQYEERVAALVERVPGLTVSTDIIVGFPGETQGEFEQTLALVQRVGFVGVFGFKYSPRPGTPAMRLADDVSEEEKSERLALLFETAEHFRHAHLKSLLGTTVQVLVEGKKADGAYTGRTERNEIVHLPAASDPSGQLLPVRIGICFNNSLGGELLDPSLSLPLSSLPRVLGLKLPVI
jgi:tRNA-2-methylthio-N6-dimethylallyladenosine synthase